MSFEFVKVPSHEFASFTAKGSRICRDIDSFCPFVPSADIDCPKEGSPSIALH